VDNKISIIRFLFYLSFLIFLILYLFPGSLIGHFLYGDLSKQPELITNPLGTSINHMIAFFFISILCLISFVKNSNFLKVSIFLILLSIIIEILHLYVPNRSFEYLDIFGNLLGTLLAIIVILLYKFKNGKI
tara:strand:- start:17626 stop:18021 length:396 start_codon:yes stop_codon:yes gene_type:complete